MSVEDIFSFTYRPTVWLSLLPALLNLGILFYTAIRFPKNKLTITFSAFVLALVGWQLNDTLARLSATAEMAEFWDTIINWATFTTPIGLHFVLLYTQHKLAHSTVFITFLYLFSLILHASLHTNLYHVSSVHLTETAWGWILTNPYPTLYANWIALLGVGMLATLLWAIRRDQHNTYRRNAMIILATGFSLPTLQGTLTQILLPELGYSPLPITSTFMSFFSLAAIIALRRYDFLNINKELIFAHAGEGIIVVDANAKIVQMNNAAQELLGFSERDTLGQQFFDVVKIKNKSKRNIPLKQHPLTQVFNTKSRISITLENTLYFTRRDGSIFPAISTFAPLIENHQTTGIIVSFRDMTVEKEIDTAKNELIALAAHELQGPPFIINWYVEKLREALNKRSKLQHEYLDKIHEANRRQSQLVIDILTASRIDRGVSHIVKTPTDIKKLLGLIIQENASQLKEKKITFKYEPTKNLPYVLADKEQLRIALRHLIGNAIKYSKPKGTITVFLKQKSNTLHLIVKDTGYGIPQKEQKHVFTKLFRAKNAKLIDPNGTGLGLYISKHIVEQMGGSISFESKENKGSVFYVSLPTVK